MTRDVFDNCILHEWILWETTASPVLYFPPTFDNRELSECVCRGEEGRCATPDWDATAASSDGAAKLRQKVAIHAIGIRRTR